MSQIVIGKAGTHNVSIDLPVLLQTRMLVTADSGGGKTFLLKRLCEQLFGKVPILIIDPEGEFAPLREQFGFVLCGKGGETPADPRSAALVAHKFLELKASAICDIYEMKPAARHEWVRKFVEALIEAPKNLRHPTVVLIDEVHMFCPEKGKGESEAADAVKDLAARGRKRGLCAIFATQRLAELNKGASGMLANRLIGPTFEDVNVKRAIEIMSVSNEDQKKFKEAIKLLEPGNFYALGRAISKDRILLKVGAIQTAHGDEAMKYAETPPPAPDAIAKLLPKLSDLPKAAEEKAKTEAELRAEIRSLKAQLRTQPAVEREVKVADPKAIERAVRPLAAVLEEVMKIIVKINAIGFDDETIKSEHMNAVLRDVGKQVQKLVELSNERRKDEFAQLKRQANALLAKMKKTLDDAQITVDVNVKRFAVEGRVSAGKIQEEEGEATRKHEPGARQAVTHSRPENSNSEAGELTSSQLRILQALVHLEALGEGAPSREQLAFWSAAPPTSGGYKNNLGALRSRGLVNYPTPGTVVITEAGRGVMPTFVFSDEEAYQAGLGLLTKSQRDLLDQLIAAHPKGLDREQLAERSGVPATSGGFKNNLGAMRTAGLIDYPSPGTVKCSEWLLSR